MLPSCGCGTTFGVQETEDSSFVSQEDLIALPSRVSFSICAVGSVLFLVCYYGMYFLITAMGY